MNFDELKNNIDLEELNKIIKLMSNNKRPSLACNALKSLNPLTKAEFHNINEVICNSVVSKDYLTKNDGTIRDNAYLVSPLILVLINYFARRFYSINGINDDIYYTGLFDNDEFFYLQSYQIFQTNLIDECTRYSQYIKLDLRNFYKNINIRDLKTHKDVNIQSITFILESLGIREFPIIQDCCGLSYIAVYIYIQKICQDIKLLLNGEKFFITSYSDDIYILFDEFKYTNNVKGELEKVCHNNGFCINEKFSFAKIENIGDEVYQTLYDMYVNDINFDVTKFLGGEVEIIKLLDEFTSDLEYISSNEEFNELVDDLFTFELEGKHSLRKNFLNEILFNTNLSSLFRKKKIRKNLLNFNYLSVIKYDPTKITLMLLLTRDEKIIKNFLHYIYCRLETRQESAYDIMAIITYMTQRNISNITYTKLVEKLALQNYNLHRYLKEYIHIF